MFAAEHGQKNLDGEAGTKRESKTVHGADISRHFQWRAYEGGAGAERWSNVGTDFHKDLDQLKDVMAPQHDYRLDAASLDGRRYGEASCRQYRESILHALPHSYASASASVSKIK